MLQAVAGGDLRDRLANRDARAIISERHRQREEDERKRWEEYDCQWGPLDGHRVGNQPPQAPNPIASRGRSLINQPRLDDNNSDSKVSQPRRDRRQTEVYVGRHNAVNSPFFGFSCFSSRVRATNWPLQLKLTSIDKYDGKSNPD